MKKVILFFSVMFLSATFTFGQLTTTLAIDNAGGGLPAGSVFTDVTVEAVGGGDNFGTFQIFILYDPAVLTPVDVTYPNAAYQFFEWANNLAYAPNEIVLTWLSFFGGVVPTPGEVLCNIEWTYTGDPDYSDLIFNEVGDGVPGWPEKGTTLVFSSNGDPYALTLNNGSVGPQGPPTWTWTGGTSSDWFDGTNWDLGTVPDGTGDVVVPAGTPNDPVIVTNDVTPEVAVAVNMTSDAPIIVGPLGYLTVLGTLTNNDFLGVISDATNSGSFIYDGPVGGTFNYWRFLSTGAGTPTSGWHYMSSPVPGFGSNNILDYYLNAWDETTSNWVQIVGAEPCVPAPEVFMDGMVGWSLKWDAAYACPAPGTGDVVEFVGAPNFGDQFGAVSASGVGIYPNFNLAGNPYPSYWDYDAFFFGPNFAAANIFDGIYYWDEDAEVYASYVNGIGTNGGSNFVPPAQGFFFEALGPGTLTYTAAEQVHVVGLPYYKDASDLVRLTATANDRTDEIVIHFNENSTVNRDNNDARKLISTAPASPNLYTMVDNIAISINGMPATESVPVYFECLTSGSVTIEATETSEFSHVVLEDLFTGIQTDLLTGSYTFDHVTGADTDRFILHFTPLGIGDNFAELVNIWSSANNIYVQVPNVTGDIVVFNMMGQEVVRTDIEPGLNTIPMNDVNTYYVVKVLTSDNAVTGKVFIK